MLKVVDYGEHCTKLKTLTQNTTAQSPFPSTLS